MFQRRFIQVTVRHKTYILGSLSEHEVSKLVGDWNSDQPLTLTTGEKPQYSRSECYRARLVAVALFERRGNVMARVHDLSTDDCLIELMNEDAGVMRVLHDELTAAFLRPKSTVADFLGNFEPTESAA